MDALCDIRLKVPAQETHKIQELHLPVYHTVCLMVEQEPQNRFCSAYRTPGHARATSSPQAGDQRVRSAVAYLP